MMSDYDSILKESIFFPSDIDVFLTDYFLFAQCKSKKRQFSGKKIDSFKSGPESPIVDVRLKENKGTTRIYSRVANAESDRACDSTFAAVNIFGENAFFLADTRRRGVRK